MARERFRRVPDGAFHVAAFDAPATVAMRKHQRLVREHVHQSWRPAACSKQHVDAAIAEKLRSCVARCGEPVVEVSAELLFGQSGQAVLERYALAQSPRRLGGKVAIELGLTEHRNLQKLALV